MTMGERDSNSLEPTATETYPRYLAIFGVYLFVISYLFLVMIRIGALIEGSPPLNASGIIELLVGLLLVEIGIVLLPFAVRYSAGKVLRMRLFVSGLLMIGLSFIMIMVPFPDPHFGAAMKILFISTAMIGIVLTEISLLLSLSSIKTFGGMAIGITIAMLGLIVAATGIIPPPNPYSFILFLKFSVTPVGLLLALVGVSMLYRTRSN